MGTQGSPHATSFMKYFLALALVAVHNLGLVSADDYYHTYTEAEAVTLWVNTIGPYHNPQETYPYYDLPYCKPAHGIETHKKVSV
jgi:transmembrane 9 superfamily protein 3